LLHRQPYPNIGRTIEYYARQAIFAVANILHRRHQKNTVPRRCRSLKETRLPTLSINANFFILTSHGGTYRLRYWRGIGLWSNFESLNKNQDHRQRHALSRELSYD
jgi:hypothetical protein